MKLSFASLGLATLVAAGCSSDSTGPGTPPATGKALVLVSFGQPGVSVVPDTGAAVGHVAFDDAFDGATFTVEGDTAISTSSKWAGDELLVADVGTGAVRAIALPAGSNPAGAAFVAGLRGAGQARYAVALRDSGAIALVAPAPTGQVPAVSLVRSAGVCPYDVLVARSALWSVDANLDCRDMYQSLGPVRLIRTTPDSAARDTITFPDSVRGAARGFAAGDEALVVATGDYAGHQARVVAVNLRTGLVRASLRFPAGWYATAARLGRDGALYVTASRGFAPYAPRAFRVAPATLTFVGARAAGADHLDLRDGAALARCDAATADDDGTLYCASNGDVASRLLVFGPAGALERGLTLASGLAADVIVR